MSKHVSEKCLYKLPSGSLVHPCRLIIRDGTLMWKHAISINQQRTFIPTSLAHEQHIIKTASRMEDLNSWVSDIADDNEGLKAHYWYLPNDPELAEGISLYFKHQSMHINPLFNELIKHIKPHETLEIRNSYLFFKRC